jgi:nicotinate-nucleotide pyrophosphorylase (carboxylating)
MELNLQIVKEIIEDGLKEDIGSGDITTNSIIPHNAYSKGIIHAKDSGIIAGLPIVQEVFLYLNPNIKFEQKCSDGERVEKGQVLIIIEGSARTILTGERLALNILQRLSGIATRTNNFVELVKNSKARVVDTRKTTPGLRHLEKYAVVMGGGKSHRFGLYDAVLIKDNHIKVAGGIANAINMARNNIPHTMKIEIEVESIAGLQEAVDAKADIIMLDNMSVDLMSQAVEINAGRCLLEASGGVNEATIKDIAATGVDIISIGALTHSIKSLDISLDIDDIKVKSS